MKFTIRRSRRYGKGLNGIRDFHELWRTDGRAEKRVAVGSALDTGNTKLKGVALGLGASLSDVADETL